MKRSNGTPRRARQSRSRRNGKQVAVLGAVAGAGLYLNGVVPTIAAAAKRCGVCPQYVAAAIPLLKHGQADLLGCVLAGNSPLIERKGGNGNGHGNGETKSEPVVINLAETLAAHLARSTAAERLEAARSYGIEHLWDEMISPLIAADRAGQ
jgi:hypothetical protein